MNSCKNLMDWLKALLQAFQKLFRYQNIVLQQLWEQCVIVEAANLKLLILICFQLSNSEHFETVTATKKCVNTKNIPKIESLDFPYFFCHFKTVTDTENCGDKKVLEIVTYIAGHLNFWQSDKKLGIFPFWFKTDRKVCY